MIYIFDPLDLTLLDPLGDPSPIARAVGHVLRDRTLIARGGGFGGGGGGGRGRRGGRVRIPAQLRQTGRATDARARMARREVELAKAQRDRARRFYQRSSAIYKAAVARQREAEKAWREAEKARKAELRILGHFLTPAQRRSAYGRRVVRGIEGQLQRGEVPSIGRAIGRALEQRRSVTSRYADRLDKIYSDRIEGELPSAEFRRQSKEEQLATIQRSRELHQAWIEMDKPKGGQILKYIDFTVFYHEAFL